MSRPPLTSRQAGIRAWILLCLMPFFAFGTLLVMSADGGASASTSLAVFIGIVSGLIVFTLPGYIAAIFLRNYLIFKKPFDMVGLILAALFFFELIPIIVFAVCMFFLKFADPIQPVSNQK